MLITTDKQTNKIQIAIIKNKQKLIYMKKKLTGDTPRYKLQYCLYGGGPC